VLVLGVVDERLTGPARPQGHAHARTAARQQHGSSTAAAPGTASGVFDGMVCHKPGESTAPIARQTDGGRGYTRTRAWVSVFGRAISMT